MYLDSLRQRPLYWTTHHQQAAMYEPVGAWNTGPAFGQKNGPAVALVGAIGSISAGMAIVGTSALLGGLMIAGGVMSGLGAITGNKTLSTLGMVAGLAGGVGQFFEMGGFEAFGNAWSAGDGISGGLNNMANQFTGDANFGVNASGMAPVVDAANPMMNQAPSVAEGLVPDINAASVNAAPSLARSIASQSSGLINKPAEQKSQALPGTSFLKDNKELALMLGTGLQGMASAKATESATAAGQGLTDARTEESKATTELLEKKFAGPQAVDVGSFGTASNAGPYGLNPDGTRRTREQYITASAEQWKKAYEGVPA